MFDCSYVPCNELVSWVSTDEVSELAEKRREAFPLETIDNMFIDPRRLIHRSSPYDKALATNDLKERALSPTKGWRSNALSGSRVQQSVWYCLSQQIDKEVPIELHPGSVDRNIELPPSYLSRLETSVINCAGTTKTEARTMCNTSTVSSEFGDATNICSLRFQYWSSTVNQSQSKQFPLFLPAYCSPS